MRIHEYGEVILCRNITFEDNRFDMELGHPGIVLLPTSENEDDVFCLYMTSDARRAAKEKNKYIKMSRKVEKQSYINIQQIVKRINIKDGQITKLDDEHFKELLEEFYNYQINLNPQKQEFLEIKSKIETLLDILNFNKEFNINNSVSRREIDVLDSVIDKKKKRMIYYAHILITGNKSDRNLEGQIFTSEKDRKYFENLIKAYDRIKNINFDKLDFNNPNNEIRQIYINLRSENYLINVDTLFKDVATIFSMIGDTDKKGELMKAFVDFEQSREAAKAKAKEAKRLRKEKEKRKKKK